MTSTRKITILLSSLLSGAAIAWAVKEWREAGHGMRGGIIGFALGALIVAGCAAARALGWL